MHNTHAVTAIICDHSCKTGSPASFAGVPKDLWACTACHSCNNATSCREKATNIGHICKPQSDSSSHWLKTAHTPNAATAAPAARASSSSNNSSPAQQNTRTHAKAFVLALHTGCQTSLSDVTYRTSVYSFALVLSLAILNSLNEMGVCAHNRCYCCTCCTLQHTPWHMTTNTHCYILLAVDCMYTCLLFCKFHSATQELHTAVK
jgi:hypothetical protein